MMLQSKLAISVLAAAALALAFTSTAYAAPLKDNVVDGQLYPQGRTPAKIENHKYPTTYYPNTELLGPEEMRITALGTGMPNPTKNQASISYLVELGNGDHFVFDIRRSAALRIELPIDDVILLRGGIS